MRALTTRKAVLLLLDEEVRAGIEAAHPGIGIDRPLRPLPPIGGVQAIEPVAVHFGAFEIAGPGAGTGRGRAACRRRRPDRRGNWCRHRSRRALTERSRIGRVNASSSKPWLDHARPAVLPVQAPVRRTVVRVGAVQIVAAAVDVLDQEVEAVERVQLEVAEQLPEHGDVDVDPAAVIFGADLERVVGFGLELEVRADATMPGQPGCAALTQIGPLPDEAVRRAWSARNSAERSRLKPPAL